MASHAEAKMAHSAKHEPSLIKFIDHWIYVFMTVMLITVVLVGFIPDSIRRIEAIEAGMRPRFIWAAHVHAVSMGAWMLLLLAQTTLMATGRREWHMQLGIIGMILAPLLVIAGLILVPSNLQSFQEFGSGAPPELQQRIEGSMRFMTDIALIQIRAGVCFLLLVFLALRARKRDPGLHKRLIILATIVPMPAAFDRMPFLYISFPQSAWTADFWPLFCIAPMFLWDLYRQKSVHKAYWIYAAIMVPAAIMVNMLWGSDWWHTVAPPFLFGR